MASIEEKNKVAQEKYGSVKTPRCPCGFEGRRETQFSVERVDAHARPPRPLSHNHSKDFEQLDSEQRQSVGGTIGGEHAKAKMAAEHGGDASAGYAEMGKKGGEARAEQAQEEKAKE
jgi:hypothetical protein